MKQGNNVMPLDDYYAVLNVDSDASPDDIRASYRRRMQTDGNHPDLGGDTDTAALINKAYAVLSDAPQREAYDAQLDILRRIAAYASSQRLAPAPAAPDPRRECYFCRTPHDADAADDPDSTCSNCGSPTGRVGQHRLDAGENRALPRLSAAMPVRMYVDWRQADGHRASTEDLSLTGARLVTRYAVAPGQRIRVAGDAFDAVGFVVHSAPRRSGWKIEHVAGVAFAKMRLKQKSGAFVSAHV